MSLSTNIQNLVTRMATQSKELRTLINGNAADLSGLNTTTKTNLVAALNEVRAMIGEAGATIDDVTASDVTVYSSSRTEARISEEIAAIDFPDTGVQIDDATPSLTTTFSSTKITNDIDAAVAALVNGAPEALDTLAELATALTDSSDTITQILTAQALRVRVDAAQSFTAPQQLQGRANIGAASAADVGDTTVDFVAIYEAGLV